MVDKSELANATSQAQNPIPFLIELLFNLLSQMITVSTIKLTSQPVGLKQNRGEKRLKYRWAEAFTSKRYKSWIREGSSYVGDMTSAILR